MTPIDKRARVLAEHLAVVARNGLNHAAIYMHESDGIARIHFDTVDDLVAWAELFALPVHNEVSVDRKSYWAIADGEIVDGCPVRGTWFGPVAAPRRLTLVGAS